MKTATRSDAFRFLYDLRMMTIGSGARTGSAGQGQSSSANNLLGK